MRIGWSLAILWSRPIEAGLGAAARVHRERGRGQDRQDMVTCGNAALHNIALHGAFDRLRAPRDCRGDFRWPERNEHGGGNERSHVHR